jgi:DNA polymerase III, alpha subunit (gram-positive type)
MVLGIVEEMKDIFINPGFHIPETVTAINHIDDEKVKDCPREKEAVNEIIDFLGEKPLICGYNSINFDEKFMNQMLLRTRGEKFTYLKHIDVIDMAREIFPTVSHKLSKMAEMLGCDMGLEFHNSIDDVMATFRVFTLLLKEYEEKKEIEENCHTYKVEVVDAKHWYKNHKLNRIYITTQPYSKTYFDLFNKAWVSDIECDIPDLEKKVYKLFNVSSIKELLKALSPKTASA